MLLAECFLGLEEVMVLSLDVDIVRVCGCGVVKLAFSLIFEGILGTAGSAILERPRSGTGAFSTSCVSVIITLERLPGDSGLWYLILQSSSRDVVEEREVGRLLR